MTAESYFTLVIEQIFSATLDRLGGRQVEASGPMIVRYEGDGWFVECYSLREDGPNYCPRVDIGPLPELGILPREKQIDIIHVIPPDSPLSRYNLLWTYSGPEKMREVYLRVRDEIFIPFAVPMLRDHSALQALVQERAALLTRQWRDEIAGHNTSIIRRRATEAWNDKNYALFLGEMERLPRSSITKLEARKLKFARKHR